jgi:hypothetical protein
VLICAYFLQSSFQVIARNPPNEIQRILNFTEHAHGNDQERNETDEGGDGAVHRVTGAL